MADHAVVTCPREADVVMLLLGAGDPYDARSLRHHLKSCRYCQDVAADAEVTFGELAATVDPVRPPDQLRERVLTAAAHTVQAVPPTPITAARTARHTRPGGHRWATAAAAAAVLAVMAGGGAWMVQVQGQRDGAVARAGTLTDVLSQIVRYTHAVLVDRGGRPLLAVAVDEPTLRVYDLGLPPPEPGRTWTLWGMRGSDATLLGTVPPGGGPIPAAGEFDAFVLSQEAGTPEQPGELVATGPLAPPSS